MASDRRRKRRNNQYKAKPIEATRAAVISIVTIVGFVAIMFVSTSLNGETPKWLGGLGMVLFTVAIGSLVYNIFQMRKKTEIRSRIICLVISLVAALIWLITYIHGLFG